MNMANLPSDLQKAIEFHGHLCPGLLIGWQAVRAVREHLNLGASEDEEIVAVAENKSCSIDAFQALLSTTYGKGNLKWLDYGKQAFTVFDRNADKAVRAVFTGDGLRATLPDGSMDRAAFTQALLAAAPAEVIRLEDVPVPPPDKAVIEPSVACASCGEMVQQSRLVYEAERCLCKPCAQKEGLS